MKYWVLLVAIIMVPLVEASVDFDFSIENYDNVTLKTAKFKLLLQRTLMQNRNFSIASVQLE